MSEQKQTLLEEVKIALVAGLNAPKAINALLVAMLYYHPHQFEFPYDFTKVPEWLRQPYLQFLLKPPTLFTRVNEAQNYLHYMQGLVEYLHRNILANPSSEIWLDVSHTFTQYANFIPLYFNTANLKEIYKQRAEIIEFSLKHQGCELDYKFGERPETSTKIRLGILSSHFTPQTETFSTLPVYQHLGRDDFEIILYTLQSSQHRLERYCAGHSDELVVLPSNLDEQVQLIRSDNLDILWVGTNVTAVTNQVLLLAAHRLARLQISSTSSCATSGLSQVDYYVSGSLTESKNAAEQYTEELVLVDGPAHCYSFGTEQYQRASIQPTRAELGIAEDAIVYVAGANFYKIIPELEAVWVEILKQVVDSRLMLYPFNPNWSSLYPVVQFKKRLARTLANHGLDESRVIILEPVSNQADVRARLHLADVYLDSFPFAGVTSLVDPLLVGLPVLTLEGNAFRSRMGAAFLRSLQISELIVQNQDEYLERAIALGTDPALREEMGDRTRTAMQQRPTFLDSRHYATQIEAVFKTLFYNQQQQEMARFYGLQQINLILFPDWSQPEEELLDSLASVFRTVILHPKHAEITLLIYNEVLPEAEADTIVAAVFMHLLMYEELEITEESLDVRVLSSPTATEWKALLPQLSARIELATEDRLITSRAEINAIPKWVQDFLPSKNTTEALSN